MREDSIAAAAQVHAQASQLEDAIRQCRAPAGVASRVW